jgi:tripartite-type tricarboxylate transporter receptor subunit TctC
MNGVEQTVIRSLFLGALMLAGSTIAPSQAAQWPERPVTMIAPYAAGGTADFLARLLSERLQHELKQTIVVENKTGAGGSIGAALVAKAAPDGYTLLVGSVATHAINPSLSKLSFDPVADLDPIILIATLPNMLVVGPAVPAKTTAELITWLKANPDKATYGSAGSGTSQHLSGELFRQRTGLTMTHVPYKGAGEIMTALIGGEVSLSFNNMINAWAAAKQGLVRPIAVTSLERNASAPDVPTVAEELKGFDATSWFGLFAPKGTPEPVAEKLAALVGATLADPEVVKKLADVGAVAAPLPRARFADFIVQEQAKWRQTIESAGLKQQ